MSNKNKQYGHMRHIEKLTTNYSQNSQDVILQSLVNYIYTSYQTASLTKFAEDFHQSVSSLSKLMKQSTGLTFQEMLQKARFRKATELLVRTDMSIDEIAIAVGYENQSYFYRRFKEIYGMTPRKYKILNLHV